MEYVEVWFRPGFDLTGLEQEASPRTVVPLKIPDRPDGGGERAAGRKGGSSRVHQVDVEKMGDVNELPGPIWDGRDIRVKDNGIEADAEGGSSRDGLIQCDPRHIGDGDLQTVLSQPAAVGAIATRQIERKTFNWEEFGQVHEVG